MTETAPAPTIWDALADRINPVLDRPRLQNGVVASRLSTSRGEEYFIVKNPATRTYVRLAPDEHYLLGLMDGNHQVKDLVLAYFSKYRRLAPRRVLHLVDELRRHRFLAEPPADVWEELSVRLRKRSWEGWLDALASAFTSREIAISGIDKTVATLYRAGGWVPFTRIGASLLVLLGGLGFLLFLRELFYVGRNPLTMGGSAGLGLLTFLGLSLVLLAIHEMGHAMAVKTYGREVNRAGFMIYYGLPAFFVDSTDIWMEPRWPRMAVTAAGPLVTWAAGGAAMFYLVIAGETIWTQIAYQLALISFINNSFNLFPLLELDGYYLLMDWLELPLLRARALAFVRKELVGRLRRRQRLNREEWVFAIFGTLALAATAWALGFAIFFWFRYGEEVAEELIRTHNTVAAVIAALVVLMLVAPVVLGAIAKARRFQRMGGLIAHLRHWRAANQARIRLDARQILERQRFLQNLEPRDRELIVNQLKLRRFRVGECVLLEGEPGDEFFFIRTGRAEVLKLDKEWPRQLATLGRGDCFGEMALLDDQPRQASVRALTTLEVYSLNRATFQSIVGPQLRRYGLTRQRLEERAELARVALFRDTPSYDLDPILDRLVALEADSGTDIIREGEAGDRFYIIRRGRVDVLRTANSGQEEKFAELGPNDYFGELALLNDAPRAATIRARGRVALWSLERTAFLDVIMNQGQLSERILIEASHRGEAKNRLAGAAANS